MGLAWKSDYLEREREIFGCDPWAYGLEPNTIVLSRFLKYCYDEGIAAKMIGLQELFFPSTLKLAEATVSSKPI
jgi:4,5-dihydroxyphthalate decarboxylase